MVRREACTRRQGSQNRSRCPYRPVWVAVQHLVVRALFAAHVMSRLYWALSNSDGCNNHIGMGVRYNAEKKKIGNYYSTPIYSFRCKCHLCDNWFTIETDPKVRFLRSSPKSELFTISNCTSFFTQGRRYDCSCCLPCVTGIGIHSRTGNSDGWWNIWSDSLALCQCAV